MSWDEDDGGWEWDGGEGLVKWCFRGWVGYEHVVKMETV
jgi:hypothetical protein